jgi:hypothetical protein
METGGAEANSSCFVILKRMQKRLDPAYNALRVMIARGVNLKEKQTAAKRFCGIPEE